MTGHGPRRLSKTGESGSARSAPVSENSSGSTEPQSQSQSQIDTATDLSTPSNATRETRSIPVMSSASATSQRSPSQPYFRVPASPRTSSMADSNKQAKVAIPRLKRSLNSQEDGTKTGGRHRVTHACEPCRHRKTKCSGERPACRHCQDFKIQCYYADGKRDRVKKQFGSMAEKVADYEKVLRELLGRVSEDDAKLIRSTLERAAQNELDDAVGETVPLPSVEGEAESEESGAESEVSGGRGSTGALDRTEEDFTRETAKATGFMGKNSDITWLQRLNHENRVETESQAEQADECAQRIEADNGFTIQDSSYHLNDLAISAYEAVDPYEWPTPDTAQMLFMTYMQRVHPSFPIVGRVNLQNQFGKFLARPTQRPPTKWLAIVNLIFAIAAKYSHLIQADWRGDERDHLVYFTRARLLAIDVETLFAHPDLQMIQILALMSYYLMASGQINRAWTLCGTAVRCATALALNMRNDSKELADSLKEIRYRLWWSIYCLEHRLCSMTGRVNCILDDHCTTPLPAPILEDEFDSNSGKLLLGKAKQQGDRAPASNNQTPTSGDTPPSADRSRSGSKPESSRSPSSQQQSSVQGDLEWTKDVAPNNAFYFLHLVQLCRLTQDVFQKLYNPNNVAGTWSDIQTQIQDLSNYLEIWYRKLPPAFDFRRKQRDRDFYEARLALGFFYYNTKQMVFRPCLCRLDRKIPNQSDKSSNFNHQAAMTCVIAAQDQLQLIPDEPNAIGLLRVGPWATMLHLLVSSATVLMLEIAFRAHHMPEQADDILEYAKKAVRWLHALGEDNLSAARAWKLTDGMLRDSAKKIGRTIDDMPLHLPRAAMPPVGDGTFTHPSGSGSSNLDQHSSLAGTMPPIVSYPGPTGGMNPAVFANYNPLMKYDEYFHSEDHTGGGLQPQHMQYNVQQPGDEIDFMNKTYNDQMRDDGRGDGGLSGFR